MPRAGGEQRGSERGFLSFRVDGAVLGQGSGPRIPLLGWVGVWLRDRSRDWAGSRARAQRTWGQTVPARHSLPQSFPCSP